MRELRGRKEGDASPTDAASARETEYLLPCTALPLPILAHQAPILPLKLRWPGAFNGTALVIGSVAPDFEYLTAMYPTTRFTGFSHSVLGQLVFCLPVTMALVLLVGGLRLGDVLVARMGARYAWLASAATDVLSPGGLRRAGVSALLGSFSHIAFDALTHRALPRWLPDRRVSLGHLSFTPATILQLVASLVGALVSLWLLRRISERDAVGVTMPVARPGRAPIVMLAVACALLAAFGTRGEIRNPDLYFDAGPLYVWGHVAFVAACGSGVGILVAGVLLAIKDRETTAMPRATATTTTTATKTTAATTTTTATKTTAATTTTTTTSTRGRGRRVTLPLTIRACTKTDLPRVVQLFAAADGNARDQPQDTGARGALDPAYAEALDAIALDVNNTLMVAESAGVVVGVFQLTIIQLVAHRGGRVAQVETVFVDPALRGKGVGDAMMRWAIAEAKRRGCFRLQLTSNKTRTRAHAFYERLGFVASHEGMKLAL